MCVLFVVISLYFSSQPQAQHATQKAMPKLRPGWVDKCNKSALTMDSFMKSVQESWFTSVTSFLVNVVFRPLTLPDDVPDSFTLRAIMVFVHYGVIPRPQTCRTCSKRICIMHREDRNVYMFQCPTSKHHYQEAIQSKGVLSKVLQSSWAALLMMVV